MPIGDNRTQSTACEQQLRMGPAHLVRALLRSLQFVTVSIANFPRTAPRTYADFPAWDLLKAHAVAQRLHDGESLLDVGCGNGHFLQKIGLFRSLSRTGIDLTIPQQPSELDLRTYDGQTLPFQDKSFDVVFFGYVLHHLTPEHASRLFAEAARVARRSVVLLEDSMPSFNVWYRARNWAHRLESDLSYAEQSQRYRPGEGERMFLTHDEWRRFLARNAAIASVELCSLSPISRYAHHTLIEASLTPHPPTPVETARAAALLRCARTGRPITSAVAERPAQRPITEEFAVSFVQLPRETKTLDNLIAGCWQPAAGAALLDVRSPYTGERIGQVPLSGEREVRLAVEAAKLAQPAWARTPLKERTSFLFLFRQLLIDNLDRLAQSCAAESGKTVAEGQASVLKGIEVCEFALSLQNMDAGGVMEVSRGISCETRREPLGVVAGIAPFNFPAMVPMWMFPIAITVGNAFILKPSEKVPLTSQILGALMLEAGYPAGVFSLVHGGQQAAEALVAHEDVRAIAFVGSTPVARAIYEQGTRLGKRVLALGGAKNHIILAPDADPSLSVPPIVDSFTGCAGQRCMAASVLLAVGDTERLIAQIVDRASRIELGAAMGAIIDRPSLSRIEGGIAEAVAAGATLALDGRGKRPSGAEYTGGNWIGPTIVDHVKPDMPLRTRELFGPVLAVVRVETLSEALAVQHDSAYGNACSVFTSSGAVAQHIATHARAGMIGVNVGVPVPREPFSFGGVNDSRFGHGDITGPDGVEFWSQKKKITTKWAVQSDTTWMG